MRDVRAGAILVVDALSRDVAPTGLDALSPRAASNLRAGQLEQALCELELDRELARVGALWPKAGKPALARFDALPSHAHFLWRLAQTLAWVVLVLLVELAVLGVLRFKVFPVVEKMFGDFDLPAMLDVVALAQGAVFALLVPVVAWVLLGASGWDRLPGWGRLLLRAKEAALGAALVETGAPEDVRAAAHRGFRTLNEPTLGALELDEAYLEAKTGAEAALERFIVAVRLVSFALLSLLALGTLVGVYGSLARLAWLH